MLVAPTRSRHRRTAAMRGVTMVLLVALLVMSVPAPAYGFNLFRELRNGVRGIGRVSGRVLAVPGKAVDFVTRPLPAQIRKPVRIIGTIALTRNLLKNPKVADVFRRARAVKGVSDDVQLIADAKARLRAAYDEEAKRFAEKAAAIDDQIAAIKADPTAGDVSKIVSLRQLQSNYSDAAQQAADRARRINDGDVVKLLANKSLIPRVLGGAKSVAKQKLDEALGGYVSPATIRRFVRGGISPEAMVELIIAGDAKRIVGERGLPDDFFDDLRDALKQQLRADADFFKKNWRAELDRIVAEVEKERGTRVAEGTDADRSGNESGDEGFTDEELQPVGPEGETEGYDESEFAGDDAPNDGTAPGDQQSGPERWVVWYGTDMGFKPIYIWEKSAFEADTPGNSIEGGGMSSDPIRKTSVGEFATKKEAMDFLDGALSDVRTASGIYAGMLIAEFQGETHNIENIGFDPRQYP